MNLLVLVSDAFGSNGGIAKYNQDFLTTICKNSDVSKVEVITRKQPVEVGELPEKLDYNTHGIGGKIYYIFEVLKSSIKQSEVNLVLCGHINLLPVAYLAAKIKRASLWLSIYGIDVWDPHPSPIVRWLVNKVEGFITISEVTKERLINWTGVNPQKFYLLPNCYDPSAYAPGPKPVYLLDRYELNGKTVLMTLGRLVSFERKKGFDVVIDLLPDLAKTIPGIHYLVAGDGPDKQRLQEKVNSLGISDKVTFTGFVPDIEKKDHYLLADAFVMPSQGEGFGFVFLEAMACGIPVVGSKLDGSREALRDGLLGILVDPTNEPEVKAAVINVLHQERGKVPAGLEYFSSEAYKQRVFSWLKNIAEKD
jgi:phosphatidylinositol alpha-1,6-mannosyltransferase